MITESKIQQQIVEYYRNTYCLKHHNPRHLIFSVPNEGKNVKEQMTKLATGMMSGVSDLIIIQPNKIIFVEVKTQTGKQSPKQILFQDKVNKLGFKYILTRSLEDFKAQIDE